MNLLFSHRRLLFHVPAVKSNCSRQWWSIEWVVESRRCRRDRPEDLSIHSLFGQFGYILQLYIRRHQQQHNNNMKSLIRNFASNVHKHKSVYIVQQSLCHFCYLFDILTKRVSLLCTTYKSRHHKRPQFAYGKACIMPESLPRTVSLISGKNWSKFQAKFVKCTEPQREYCYRFFFVYRITVCLSHTKHWTQMQSDLNTDSSTGNDCFFRLKQKTDERYC